MKEGFRDLQAVFAILVERNGIVIVQDSYASVQKTNMRLCEVTAPVNPALGHAVHSFERESYHNEKGSIYNQRK